MDNLKANQKEQSNNQGLILKLTLQKLEKRFPNKSMLTISETAEALNLPGAMSIRNSLRKNIANPFPIKHRKTCGKIYFNIINIAKYLAEV